MRTTSSTGWCSTRRDAIQVVSYGDLITPAEYRFHSRFSRAINFVCGERLLSIVDEYVGPGPLNIVVRDAGSLNADCLTVSRDGIRAGDCVLSLDPARRYDSSLPVESGVGREKLWSNLSHFRQALTQLARPGSLAFLLDSRAETVRPASFAGVMHGRFLAGTEMIAAGRFADGARSVAGLGTGLTPSGDDLIAGLLIAFRVRQVLFELDLTAAMDEVCRAAKSDNVFSTAFLSCARQGRVFDRFKRVVAALLRGDSGEVAACTRDLATIGHNSGIDLGVGLALGLAACFRRQERVRTLFERAGSFA